MKHLLMHEQQRIKGFTLIEVMIVMLIVGILTALAYPSYQEYVRRAARADAQSDMMEVAQQLERFFTMNNRYDQSRAGVPFVLTVVQSPRSGNARYNFGLVTANAGQTYVLQAVPVAGQALDVCGTLGINQAGVTTPPLGTDNRPCW
jgi:type IV pilus assembly protein PilE